MADTAFGSRVERREDPALLTGRSEYTDDLSAPRMVHLDVLRSQHAHARIEEIDTAAAEALDGVHAVYTADDVAASDVPGVLPVTGAVDIPGHPMIAGDRVRYQGEPIAAVVADDRYRARDGVDAIEVDYDRLEPVVDPERAGDGPAIFEEAPDNVATDWDRGDADAVDDAFSEADHTVRLDLENNRLIPNAIEPRAALATPSGDGKLTVEMTSQGPHGHRSKLSTTLGVPERKIRVIAPDVGGGFGHKGHHHPGEALASFAALDLDRPVKWIATRTENYLAGAHARDHRTDAELAFDDDGTFRGLRVDTTANVGAYVLGGSTGIPTYVYAGLLSGQYAFPTIHLHVRAVLTNTTPLHSYRGAGRPEAIYLVERLADEAAREIDMDPVEIRRRNLIEPDAFPYETAIGTTYDSGEYEKALDAALEAAGYDDLRERRVEAIEDGRYLGVGVANYVESTSSGYESGVVRADPSGGVTVYAGTHSHGQGHGTTYAQVVADELGIDQDEIEVVEGDTESIPKGTGTFGSRSAAVGGSAVAESAREVARKARELAAHRLEADEGDVEMADGEFRVAGAPDRAVDFAEVAGAAYGGDRPDGMERGLEATSFFEADGGAYTFGTHVAFVEVRPDTGEVELLDYVAVDDCGERINPMIVEGQVHGGVAQGIGQALTERTVYDDAGNLVTGSLQDYAIPKAEDVPDMTLDETVTPSPNNPLGVKGIGEAGTIAAPPAVVNAAVDAVQPLGVDTLDMPLTAERVWRAIHDGPE